MTIVWQLILLVIGFVLLVKGADYFVEGVSDIATRFGIPQIVIGLTVVAFGTSAPEAAISITASISGSGGVAVGNIIGSNIINVWLILGISAVVSPMIVKKNTVRFEIPFTIGVSAIFLIMGMMVDSLHIISGIILWVMMFIILGYLFISAKSIMKKEITEEVKPQKKINLPITILISLLGGAAVIFGANMVVDSATEIAKVCGISEDIIGLTIVAFGTSLPELVTSVTASKKGKNDIAIGNIVGSNIFNILFVIGTSALISPVPFSNDFLIDGIVMIAAIITLFLFVLRKRQLTRIGGIGMLVLYAGYFAYLITQV